jgi:hypothetical protein
MHIIALAVLLLLAILPASLCFAQGLTEEILLSTKDNITAVSGDVGSRETRSDHLRISAA